MALETLDWLRRIKSIENEYRVAFIAMRHLAVDAERDPGILGKNLQPSVIPRAQDNLNATYAIRMFAEFETGLRAFWVVTKVDPEPSRVAEIIDRIASGRRIVGDFLINAHRVRIYRNRQVHDNLEVGESVSVAACRSFLKNYLARMPQDWVPHS